MFMHQPYTTVLKYTYVNKHKHWCMYVHVRMYGVYRMLFYDNSIDNIDIFKVLLGKIIVSIWNNCAMNGDD